MTKRLCAAILSLSAIVSARAADTLTGGGATFPAPLYQKWIAAFEAKYPGLPIAYQAIGSEKGIERFKNGDLDFAASDMIPEGWDQNAANAKMLPTVVGAVVPVYNLPGLRQEVRFSPEVLAGIFWGDIRQWNDRRIANINREIRLPGEDIVVVHRSDGSGTTYVLSDFLCKTVPDWKVRARWGSTLNWPVGTTAVGNEGVSEEINRTKFSIGYVEFIYAVREHLSYGLVRNSAGKFVRADIDSVTAAAETAQASADFKISITNAPGPKSYPIASITWFLVPNHAKSDEKNGRIKQFLAWALSSGQRQAAALGYVALPAALADRVTRYLADAQ